MKNESCSGVRMPGVVLLVAAALLGTAPRVVAQVPGSKLSDGTVVPDFSGIWERIEGIRFNPGGQMPPYNAEYRRRYDLAMEARNRGERVADPTSRCLPQGMPRFMVASYPLEILQTKGQVTIIAEWSSQVRRIFTDGRGHPPADEIDITFNGHSVGRWEGQALVVDTVGIRGDTSFDASPLTHSDQLTVSERIYLQGSADAGRGDHRHRSRCVHGAMEGGAHVPARWAGRPHHGVRVRREQSRDLPARPERAKAMNRRTRC